ncbi:hypothetical protein PUN28_012640 [Cardiocondyla obscurior]|uniref:Uncharacterized protein n=1 Tax=Cardiocondyla obscurior TaxID=286306 RepID=A0AAW2FCG8_9HYME
MLRAPLSDVQSGRGQFSSACFSQGTSRARLFCVWVTLHEVQICGDLIVTRDYHRCKDHGTGCNCSLRVESLTLEFTDKIVSLDETISSRIALNLRTTRAGRSICGAIMGILQRCDKAKILESKDLSQRTMRYECVCSTPRQTEHVRILGLGCHVISGEMIVTTVLTTGNFSRRESDGGPRRRIDHDDEP